MGLPDYVRNEQDELAYNDGYVLDLDYARRHLAWFPRFVNHFVGEYAGQPFEPLPWQRDRVLLPAFGWVHQDEMVGKLRRRRFRTISIWVPKKNGKSTLCSALGLKLLTETPGANVYTCAVDGKHARIVHGAAMKMVRASPKLDSTLRIRQHESMIYDPAFQGEYTTLSWDPNANEGWDAYGLIIDEIHAWKNAKFWEVVQDAGAARRNHMRVIISTAGEEDDESVGYRQYEYAKLVEACAVPDYQTLPVIYEAGKDDDIHCPQVWARCNPSLGSVLDPVEMRSKSELVKQRPREEHTFRRRRLNQWVGMAERWIPPDSWKACAHDDVDEKFADAGFLYAGLDRSDHDDLTALTLAFSDGEKVYVRPYIWVAGDTLAEKQRTADYRRWVQRGDVIVCKGGFIQDDDILDVLNDILQVHWIEQLAYDPWQMGRLVRSITDRFGLDCGRFTQTPRQYNEPARYFERLIEERRLAHPNNEALNWTVLNMSVEEDRARHIMPKKPGNKARKIDPGCATIMALAALMYAEQGVGTTAWT